MRKQFLTIVLLLTAFSLILGGTALASSKVGYFEMSMVLQNSKTAQQSSQEFKRQSDAIRSQVEKKAQEFTSAREDFEKRQALMDDRAKGQRIEELQRMQMETDRFIRESNTKLNRLSGELTSPIVDKVFEVVRKIGRDGGYDFIFEREKAGIVFVNEKEDLTDRIIRELDRM